MDAPPQSRQSVAHRLRSAVPHIVDAWVAALREDGSAPANRQQWVDELPTFLTDLAAALEDEERRDLTLHQARKGPRSHGAQRRGLDGYKLGQLVDEYALLRRLTVRRMQEGQSCPPDTLELIHSFFDTAICEATETFEQFKNQAAAEVRDAEQRGRQDLVAETAAALADSEQGRAAAEVERDSILRRAKEREEATQMRSNIISMLGHDMRSPLNSASVNAQMIARSPKDVEGVVKRAQRVVAAVERIDSMIQNLLDADRLESGDPLALDIEHHDLAHMVRQTYDDLVLTHGPRFSLEAPAHLEGYWDLCALQRTLENLCANAVKYGDPKRDITIRLEARDDDGVVMSVHNWGAPLSADCLSGLFKPRFRRIEEVQKVKHGWGLGLALVRAMALAHGGQAHVRSTADQGTTFYVEVPRDGRDARLCADAARADLAGHGSDIKPSH